MAAAGASTRCAPLSMSITKRMRGGWHTVGMPATELLVIVMTLVAMVKNTTTFVGAMMRTPITRTAVAVASLQRRW